MAAKGQPKSGGRQKGTPNKAAGAVKALAQKHGKAAIDKLVALMDSKDERIQLAACNAILDRAVGRPAQTIGGDPDKPVELIVKHLRLDGGKEHPR